MKRIFPRASALLLQLCILMVLFSACVHKEEVTQLPVTASVKLTERSNYNTGEGSIKSMPELLPVEKKEQVSKTKKKNLMIAIDAGHQTKANNKKEPIGPGATITKPKVSSGTKGISSGVPEYKLNLVIAQKVKEELIHRGYEIYMIREKNDVNISNRKRAEMANESGADIFIRIHADGSDHSEVNGTSTLYPSEDNLYVPELSDKSYALSKAIVDAMCERTGAKNRGTIARDDMSGINWSEIPVSIIEMGYMSNKKEDKLMQTEEYQDKIVLGICDGIDDYYD